MGKKDNDTRGLADVELYFNQIRTLLKRYRRIVEQLDAIKKDKKKALEKLDLISERDGLLKQWQAKKDACRSNIKMLPESLGILKDKELKDLQEEFREINTEFKALGVMAERATLMEGAAERHNAAHGRSRMNNDELLEGALSIQQNTTNKLKDALSQVEQTKETGKYTAATLEQSREKIKRIDQGLDEVESELEISRKLITRFVKRIYTDKVIIAFTFLIVVALVGIIVYATLNPNQKIFNVPDAVKPNIPGVTVSYSPTPAATPTPSPGHALLRRLFSRSSASSASSSASSFESSPSLPSSISVFTSVLRRGAASLRGAAGVSAGGGR